MRDLHVGEVPDRQVLVEDAAPGHPEPLDERVDGGRLVAGVVAEVEIDLRAHLGVAGERLQGQVVQLGIVAVAEDEPPAPPRLGQEVAVADPQRVGARRMQPLDGGAEARQVEVVAGHELVLDLGEAKVIGHRVSIPPSTSTA